MTAAILWIFIVTFPTLMGAPVIAPVAGISEEHCKKVRKLFSDQLPRPTNVAMSECERKVLTVGDAP